jgi:hypothetical protein
VANFNYHVISLSELFISKQSLRKFTFLIVVKNELFYITAVRECVLLYLHVGREFLMSLSERDNISLELHYISLHFPYISMTLISNVWKSNS